MAPQRSSLLPAPTLYSHREMAFLLGVGGEQLVGFNKGGGGSVKKKSMFVNATEKYYFQLKFTRSFFLIHTFFLNPFYCMFALH